MPVERFAEFETSNFLQRANLYTTGRVACLALISAKDLSYVQYLVNYQNGSYLSIWLEPAASGCRYGRKTSSSVDAS
jgi:hypothetical protein